MFTTRTSLLFVRMAETIVCGTPPPNNRRSAPYVQNRQVPKASTRYKKPQSEVQRTRTAVDNRLNDMHRI
jgi:hypothetical protein